MPLFFKPLLGSLIEQKFFAPLPSSHIITSIRGFSFSKIHKEMLPLPPPPQSPKPTRPSPFHQIVLSKQGLNQQSVPLKTVEPHSRKLVKAPILRQPRRTNPIVWCGAVICLLFCLVLIFFGVAILIIFLNVKPRNPIFDTPAASLGSIYFDSSEYFNGDFTFLANFSNPNRKVTVTFEYVDLQLYFLDRLIGTQTVEPFTQKPRETKLEPVHMISSLVYLPHRYAGELQKQVQGYKVMYIIQGNFRVRATLGLTHFTYWIHGRCKLVMTGPPTGALVSRRCAVKR